ncbi:MAG: fatty acid desaturase [Nocardioides sp.]|nr:fatty acid desaturase [Nocardioides sp.]
MEGLDPISGVRRSGCVAHCPHRRYEEPIKGYLLFPARTGPLFPLIFAGSATANLVRNMWAFSIIFCGHFPAGVATFSEEECEDESRGHWYYRQLLGSANITGSRLLHLMSGNLSHQVEHHLFPDIPARRYPEIVVQVREICERYGLDYHQGPLGTQLFSVARKICRFALPERGPTTGQHPAECARSWRPEPAPVRLAR